MDTEGLRSARLEMVEIQIAARGIHTAWLLQAMQDIPRHHFIPPDLQAHAYEDRPLPIGSGQTISQPYIVALMTELLDLKGGEKVLEIGTGSGYQSAILSCSAEQVHTIEFIPTLAKKAEENLKTLDIRNVFVHIGDGGLGFLEAAPYKGILVTAAAPVVPAMLLDQLAEGGTLVLPVGGMTGQYLQVWQRQLGELHVRDIIPVSFVPLRGQYGWKEDAWGRC